MIFRSLQISPVPELVSRSKSRLDECGGQARKRGRPSGTGTSSTSSGGQRLRQAPRQNQVDDNQNKQSVEMDDNLEDTSGSSGNPHLRLFSSIPREW